MTRPQSVAAADRLRRVTFGQLAREAAVIRAGVRAVPGRGPVALLHSHDARALPAVFGVLASGRPLVVLDPQTPAPRLRQLIARARVGVCVTDAVHAELAGATAAYVLVPERAITAADSLDQLWSAPPDPGKPAVLAFTSGTTGRPKIVLNDHRMLVRDAWANSVGSGCYTADDVVAHLLPLSFHAGLMATVAGLLVGASLRFHDVLTHGIGTLAPWVAQTGATVAHLSPALARALVAARPDPAQLAGLRAVTIAGEPFYGQDADALRDLLGPDCVVHHRYGSSETGLISNHPIRAGVRLPAGPVTVGTAVGGGRVTLVDEAGEPVGQGETGIVEVTSAHLAGGYWGDPAATAAAFTHHPDGTQTYRTSDLGRFDTAGQLHLLGRRDHSLKVRGYLVEPGEVDAALFGLPDVAEAVTVGVPRPDGVSHRLVAYVVPRGDRPSAAGLRAGLRAVLPAHMVPQTVVFLAALPRTERGKIDRAALPPPTEPAAGEPPRSEWESLIAQVWARALELDEVSRDADFFELGGDSLAAETLISMVIGDLGVPEEGVSSALLVQAPTVALFAALLHRNPDRDEQTLSVLQSRGELPPLFLVAGGGGLGVGFVPLARHLGAGQPSYALHARALERRGLPDWSVSAAARRHVQTLRSVQPHGPYYLGGHSFGGLLAFEMAQQLLAAGERVGLLVVMDSFPPDPALLPPGPSRSPFERLRDTAGLAATGLVSTPGIGQYWRFHRQSQFLSRRYRSRPYPGRTLVLLADSDQADARGMWGPHLSGTWRLERVGGDHESMLREPYAGQIAQLLADELALARADAAPPER